MIKHSILLMTYNQEDFISEAIVSCVNQNCLPFEVIILDDSSNDRTWEIVRSYEKSFPELIKAYRNDVNEGIYYTYEKLKTLASGNVFSYLAGDDFLLPECINDINSSIIDNNLNPDIDKFIIVTNNFGFYKDGRKWVTDNFSLRFKSPVKTMLRQALGYRGIGISQSLHKVVLNTSSLSKLKPEWKYSIDSIKGLDEVINADHIIFINTVSTAQRLGVGVTSASTVHQLSKNATCEFINHFKIEYSNYLDKDDLLFLKYLKIRMLLISSFNSINFLKFSYLLICNHSNFEKNDPFWRQFRFLIPREILTLIKKKINN